jgi:hypothetical protein
MGHLWTGSEWHACARRLSAIAGSPELYPELVRLGGVPPILALLSHDNGDIAAAAVELLREMTDADAVEDSVRARACVPYQSQSQEFPCCAGCTQVKVKSSIAGGWRQEAGWAWMAGMMQAAECSTEWAGKEVTLTLLLPLSIGVLQNLPQTSRLLTGAGACTCRRRRRRARWWAPWSPAAAWRAWCSAC